MEYLWPPHRCTTPMGLTQDRGYRERSNVKVVAGTPWCSRKHPSEVQVFQKFGSRGLLFIQGSGHKGKRIQGLARPVSSEWRSDSLWRMGTAVRTQAVRRFRVVEGSYAHLRREPLESVELRFERLLMSSSMDVLSGFILGAALAGWSVAISGKGY